jgi:hypothetical protein
VLPGIGSGEGALAGGLSRRISSTPDSPMTAAPAGERLEIGDPMLVALVREKTCCMRNR